MSNTYFLNRSRLYFLIILSIIAFQFSYILSIIIILIVFMLLLFFYIRKPIEKSKTSFLSPISGKVRSIIETSEGQEVIISQSLFFDWGIYSPMINRTMSFGIIEKEKSKDGWVNKLSSLLINQKNLSANSMTIDGKLMTCQMNFMARNFLLSQLYLNVDIGDKAQQGAVMGFYLGGGKLSIHLPKEFKFEIQIGDRLIGGRTSLGTIHE